MTARLNGQTLPDGWMWTTVDQLGTLGEQTVLTGPFGSNLGRDDFAKSGTPVLTIGCLTEQGLSRDKLAFISEAKAQELSRYRVRKGDLLFSRMATVGRAGLVTLQFESAIFNYHLMRLRLADTVIHPNFFLFYVRGSHVVTDYVKEVNHGATRDGINTQQLLALPVVLPPLNEQHRIVEAIETQFTRLDAAVTALKRSQANLKRYRAAVLKAACEGRLVPTEAELAQAEGRSYETASVLLERILAERRRKWEAENPKKRYQEPVAPDTSGLPELPEGWCWVKLDQVADISGGLTKNSKRDSLPYQLPYLRVANVYADRLALEDVQVIGVTKSEVDRVLLKKNDLLIVEGNGSPEQIGRVAIWDGSIEPCLHQNHLIKARFSHINVVGYVRYWLLSVGGRDVIMRVASSTSGLYTLSLSKVSDLVVPLPPLAEQQRIVAEVERRLSLIDQLEKTIEADLVRANRLRQSILKRAFAGQLVPQDPNDEPASVLLERIQAAKQGKPVQPALSLA